MIKLKGTNNGYVLQIDNNTILFEQLLDQVVTYLRSFERGLMVNVQMTHRLNEVEEAMIYDLFKAHGVVIKSIQYKDEPTSNLEVIKRSIRGGELIFVDGDCLVVGNINPEAVLRVSGFVYILGKVLGRVECKSLSAAYIHSNYVYIHNEHLKYEEYYYATITFDEVLKVQQFAFHKEGIEWEKLL